jgi:hypothetical protein
VQSAKNSNRLIKQYKIHTQTNEGHEQASKGNSKIINIGTLNLSMSQDIVQKVSDYHQFKGKTSINDKHRELKESVSSFSLDNPTSKNNMLLLLINTS